MHFAQSPSDCPPQQYTLPLPALHFPLSSFMQSVIYLFLQLASCDFFPFHGLKEKKEAQALPPSFGLRNAFLGLSFHINIIMLCYFMQHYLYFNH